MARHQPGTFVLDVAAALRGEEFGPYKVVADASPSSIHARLPNLGCGDEIVLPAEDVVPAKPRLEAHLGRVAEKALARRSLRLEQDRGDEERRLRASVRRLVDSCQENPEAPAR
jgi:hypothetical protein